MSRPTPNTTEELINDILARYRRSQQRQQLQERQEKRCGSIPSALLVLPSSSYFYLPFLLIIGIN